MRRQILAGASALFLLAMASSSFACCLGPPRAAEEDLFRSGLGAPVAASMAMSAPYQFPLLHWSFWRSLVHLVMDH